MNGKSLKCIVGAMLVAGLLGPGCASSEVQDEVPPTPCFGDLDCDISQSCVEGFCVERQSECISDPDCPVGQICEGEACRTGCRGDADCPEDNVCNPVNLLCQPTSQPCGGACGNGTRCDEATGDCIPIDDENNNPNNDPGCQDDNDCPGNQECEQSQCVDPVDPPECQNDGDCPDGQRCDVDTCVPDEPTGCQNDNECSEGQICQNTACVPGCRGDADCDGGDICIDNQCSGGCRFEDDCPEARSCIENVCSCTDDAFEDNDQTSAAAPLSDGTAIAANICGGDEDFFEVQIGGNCTIQAELVFAHADGDLQIELLNNNGQQVAATNTTSDNETLSVLVEQGGRHFLKVSGVSGGENTYRMTFDVLECSPIAEGLVLSEIFYDAPNSDDGKEWVELFNGSDQTINLSNFSIGVGGSDYTSGTFQLEGTIAPGGCFVVGGPTSNADNGNPSFDQELGSLTMQNGGSASDGVALFAVPASQITAQTLPIDTVVYDSPNENGLINTQGMPSQPDVGDAGAGESLERQGDTWVIQENPTPNNCQGR